MRTQIVFRRLRRGRCHRVVLPELGSFLGREIEVAVVFDVRARLERRHPAAGVAGDVVVVAAASRVNVAAQLQLITGASLFCRRSIVVAGVSKNISHALLRKFFGIGLVWRHR